MKDIEPKVKIIDARGTYMSFNRRISVESPADLVKGGIWIHPNAVKATWGEEGLVEYNRALKAQSQSQSTTIDNDALYSDLDPRTVATQAAVRDARRAERLFEPGNRVMPVHMQPKVEYTVSTI